MRSPRVMDRSFGFLGSRVPVPLGLLIGFIIFATCLAAAGRQAGWPILEMGALIPALVFQGQVWRLVTWSLFEFSWPPIGLVIACACLLSFGRTLCDRWGWRRFYGVYFGLTAGTGLLTCLVGLAWPAVLAAPYFTSWAVIGGLIVAWAILNPYGQILFNFLLPVSGRQIVFLTLAMIVLGAFFAGPVAVLPDLIAYLIVLVWFRDPGLRRLWYRMQLGILQKLPRRRPSHLRPVDSRDDDRPRWYH